MPDVIVIGAGVVGSATAHALTAAGAQVVVLDSGQVGAGTSAATFAVDITRVKTPRVLFDLSLAGATEHRTLQAECSGDIWLHPTATVEWEAERADRVRLRERVERLHDWGYPASWLTAQQIQEVEPALAPPPRETEVAFFPDGGWYEPQVLSRVLLRQARRKSAVVHLGDPVLSMDTSHGRITEVRTRAGRRLSADVVVNCAGPQASEVARLTGAQLPLGRIAGMVVTTSPVPRGLRTILAGPDLNLRPHIDDRVMMHSWQVDRHLDVADTGDAASRRGLAEDLLNRAQSVLPGLRAAHVHSTAVGIRPVPPDGLPIVGYLPEVANLYVVVSHSAVHLALILGRLAAAELSGAIEARLEPFRPTRFQPDTTSESLDENTRTMLARIGVPAVSPVQASPASLRRTSARSVASHVKSASSRPK